MSEPLYGRYAIDKMIGFTEGKDVDFVRLIALWIGVYVSVSLTQGIVKYLRWEILRTVLTETRERYYQRALALDIQHHVQARGGEIMKKIDNAADAAHDLSSQILMELTPSLTTSLAFAFISFYVNWKLALVYVFLAPVYLLLMGTYARWSRKQYDKVNALWVQSLGRAYDVLANIFTVKSSANEEREINRMKETHKEGIRTLRKISLRWAIFDGIGYFMLLRIAVISYGMYLLVHDELTLGSLFFFQFSFFRVIIPFEMMGNMLTGWTDKISKLQIAEDLYQKDTHVTNKEGARTPDTLEGEITFKEVSFSYESIDALSDINLQVKPGEHIALVGHSGAGKSTIAMLLNRFYDVSRGSILIDGTDIRDVDIFWWRKQIGLVLQENITFNDSIFENIRYSREDATEEEVIEAATRACAHDFISKFPSGYETLVGERGIKLSGGERQRIAIARAILKNPRIVVLDEATSALDSITEKYVQEGIKSLIQDRTSFIIAHRLSTVRSVDRIAVLDQGKLIACDSHEALLKTCKQYATMVELQQGGILPE